MTNKEKHPNTDDALKAFEEHNKHCDCGCSFEEWLDIDPDEIPVGFGFAALGLALLSRITKDAKQKSEPTGDEKKPDEAGDIECPICHGKSGKIDCESIPCFTCPDCGAYIGVNDISAKTTFLGLDGFKSFITDLCKKNNAKD